MSTIEKQWVQIFERQQWVINQAKQQAFLFDQDLSSKLLLAGIPDVLNHHELISEVPFPCTRRVIPFTGTDCCGFDKPVATAQYKQLTDGLCTEHCAVFKGFDVGDNILDLPQCTIGGCASNGFSQHLQEEDPSVTSPEDEGNAKVSGAYHFSAIQLAKSAGEEVSALPQAHIRDTGRASIAVLQDQREENCGGTSPEGQSDVKMICLPRISNGGCASNGVTQDKKEEDPSVASSEDERDARVSDVYHNSAVTPFRGTVEDVSILPQCLISENGCALDGVIQDHEEENLGGKSPDDQRDARTLDNYFDPALSLARVQRSKSRQMALAIRNSTQKSCSQDKDNVDGYAAETIKCLISTPQSENVNELNKNHSEVEKPKLGQFQSKERASHIYSGRITRSRSSGHQENSSSVSRSPCNCKTSGSIAVRSTGKSTQLSNHVLHSPELVSYSTRSRSSGHQENSLSVSRSPCNCKTSGSIAVRSTGKSTQLSNHVLHSPELVSYSHKTNDSWCEGELKSGDYISKEKRAVEEDSMSENLGRDEHTPKALQEVKDPSISKDDAGDSIFYRSPVEETHLNEDHDIVQTSGSSPEAQRKEGGMGFEVVDSTPNGPLTSLQIGRDCLVHSPVKEVSGSNAAKSTELVSEENAVDSKALCNPYKSTDGGYAIVCWPGSQRILDAGNLEVENPYAASRDELRSNLVHSTVNAYISPKYLQRSVGDDRGDGGLEPTECQTAENSKGRSISHSMEGTSPKHKRRKIDDERVHDLSTSVALREEISHAVIKDSMSASLEREEHSPTALQQVQGLSVSQEDAGKLTVSRSHAEGRHQNEDHMVERSESLPQTQKKEGGTGLEGVGGSPSVPFTFLDGEKEASVFSRLIMPASKHPQDFLLEETAVALQANINIDGGSHCLKEDPLCFHLQDDTRLETAEDVSCAGRTMLAKRFDFGGISSFTELSVGAPHVKSLDLTSADDAMPVLQRFVIKIDDDPHSIAEEGISFDEWNLPNNAVERASILEQLCKSACMQTPVAYSSASFELERVENLQQSVPTGVLEHVDLMTTFPINDNVTQSKDGNGCSTEDVGPAFYGRSYSDCLPNFTGQSGWDIKNPYSSPVGNVWDRIASSSLSSGKRVSSIPELACITEEIENTDEVADTFQDGVVSEVLDYSPKRPPLADITEIPNLPVSVSQAVPYSDRFSLDSVTTEFSLTGTHKSVKKKPGIQNGTKRRYNNKENQNVSRGTKDTKRATGSLQNRYSKPKLSGKTILRKGGPSLSDVEPKPNNIITNMTSFIPLVQQKQAAAALPGKRDIKVKALEAAEAAKRLAERKDYERKMKKEALKVERARVEQENLRKLELQRKRKEEERKKNEADMAAKKRQREEEDKKEKQRKKMRVEEGRREQREHEEKSRVEKVKKELKCHASDGRGRKNKESKCNTVHKKLDEEMEHDTLRSISETDFRSSCVSANNARTGTAVHEEYKGFSNFKHKEEGNFVKATENEKLVVKRSQEQSYDISPYKESDDEDEEDDDSIPNNKFIPSWASKNRLAAVASRQSVPEPEMIFHPKSFLCISEVLLPRKYQIQ